MFVEWITYTKQLRQPKVNRCEGFCRTVGNGVHWSGIRYSGSAPVHRIDCGLARHHPCGRWPYSGRRDWYRCHRCIEPLLPLTMALLPMAATVLHPPTVVRNGRMQCYPGRWWGDTPPPTVIGVRGCRYNCGNSHDGRQHRIRGNTPSTIADTVHVVPLKLDRTVPCNWLYGVACEPVPTCNAAPIVA